LEDYTNTILLQNSRFLLVLEDYKKTPINRRGTFFPKNYFRLTQGIVPPISDKMTYVRGDTGGRGDHPTHMRGYGGKLSTSY
jgi:hypothetical protein